MLDNSQTTIKLTDEQTLQLETYQTRLANLEGEISIATKNIKALKSDTEHAIKEKTYQEEQLATLTSQIETKTLASAKLDEQITEKTAQLNELLSQFKEHTDLMAKGKSDHEVRESKVVSEEQKLAEHTKVVEQLTAERLAEEESFNSKVAKLKEVISTF
jgi:chromosome segregation ATPase